jgi:hypothetical protein
VGITWDTRQVIYLARAGICSDSIQSAYTHKKPRKAFLAPAPAPGSWPRPGLCVYPTPPGEKAYKPSGSLAGASAGSTPAWGAPGHPPLDIGLIQYHSQVLKGWPHRSWCGGRNILFIVNANNAEWKGLDITENLQVLELLTITIRAWASRR